MKRTLLSIIVLIFALQGSVSAEVNPVPQVKVNQESWAKGVMKFNYCLLKSEQSTITKVSENDASFEKNMSEDLEIFQSSKTITLTK